MEPELIIIKPAELFLKSKPVRAKFFKQLTKNIKAALLLNSIDFDHVIKEESRLLVYTDEIAESLDVIKNIFGIAKLAPAVQTGSRLEVIKEHALEQAKDAGIEGTFDVKTKRVFKQFPLTSVQISQEVRKFLADNTNAKVKYKNPDLTIYIELLENKSFIYTSLLNGLGGLPIPVSGKVLCLCDSSLDSIVAAWLFLRRGCEVVPLHLRVDEKEHSVFLRNVGSLEKFSYGSRLKPHSIKLDSSKDLVEQADKYAQEVDAKAIVLATQNVNKLKTLKGQTELPIFTPLLGLSDKEIKSLKKIIQQA